MMALAALLAGRGRPPIGFFPPLTEPQSLQQLWYKLRAGAAQWYGCLPTAP